MNELTFADVNEFLKDDSDQKDRSVDKPISHKFKLVLLLNRELLLGLFDGELEAFLSERKVSKENRLVNIEEIVVYFCAESY